MKDLGVITDSSLKTSVHSSEAVNNKNRMVRIINEGRKTAAKTSLCHFINPWCSHSLNTACFSRHPTSKRIAQQKETDKDNQMIQETIQHPYKERSHRLRLSKLGKQQLRKDGIMQK